MYGRLLDRLVPFGFVGLLGFVSYIVAGFLNPPVGSEDEVRLVGTVSAIAGGAIGHILRKTIMSLPLILTVVVSLGLFVLSFIGYLYTADLSPRPCDEEFFCPANVLLFWTVGMFVSASLLASIARVELTGSKSGSL